MERMAWRAPSLASAVFYLLLSFQVTSVITLPFFPSLDGPMHLYYADVTCELLRQSGAYGNYYYIGFPLPPYSPDTYFLMAAKLLFAPLVAEKLLVCAYVIILCLGFRYLVRSFSPQAGVFSMFVFPFVMNFVIYSGFYNFSLGLGATLFLAGYWSRHHNELGGLRLGGFLAQVVLLALTHLAAVAMALAFVAAHLGRSIASECWPARRSLAEALGRRRRQVVAFLPGLLPLAYGLAVVGPGRYARPGRAWADPGSRLRAGLAVPLAAFRHRPYRGLLCLVALAAGAWLIYRLRKEGRRVFWSADGAAFWLGLACLAAYMVVPDALGGSSYVPLRFFAFGTLFLLASCACGLRAAARWAQITGLAVAIVSCGLIVYNDARARQLTEELAPLVNAGIGQASGAGAIVAERYPRMQELNGWRSNPYMWAPAHVFRNSQSVLVNAPWLNLPFMILRTTHPEPYHFRDPAPLARYLSEAIQRPGARRMPELDFLIAVRYERDGRLGEGLEPIARFCGLSEVQALGPRFILCRRPSRRDIAVKVLRHE